jgi:hypothetical protein
MFELGVLASQTQNPRPRVPGSKSELDNFACPPMETGCGHSLFEELTITEALLKHFYSILSHDYIEDGK